MERILELDSVAQVHKEVATFCIYLVNGEPVPSMRVKITEDMVDGIFTAWGELAPRRLSDGSNGGQVADGKTVEEALFQFLTQFEKNMEELRTVLGRTLKESDFLWRKPGEF